MYTSQEINRISGSRLAIYNRQYLQDNGDIWVGTADNRLKRLFIKDKTIGVELNATDPTLSLNDYLKDLKVSTELTQDFMNSYKWAQKNGYKEFIYTGDNISKQIIYTNNSPSANILFTVNYTYTGDNLSKIYIEKQDSSFTLTKTFNYDTNNNLINITII